MKLIIVAILFAFVEADVKVNESNCIIIRDVDYDKEILKHNVQSPYQLAIDHDTNTLFFSFTARSDEMFKSAYLSLKTGEYGIVSGIHGGFATAININSGIVYMGGEDGIYQFNYSTKKATNLHITNVNVWQMFYKDGLYFTTYPDEKAYLYKDDKVVEVPEVRDLKVTLLAVDNDANIVYANSSGVFQTNKAKHAVILKNNEVANAITSDIDGNIYFTTPTGVYHVNNKPIGVEKLATIDNLVGMAIESNGNIIYATEESIIRLNPSKKACSNENEPKKAAANFFDLIMQT